MNWTQQEIDECIELCRQKAMVDAAFRNLLLSDLKSAVKEISGKDMPDGINVKVIESDPSYVATFVLPPLVSSNVSDDELDEIAGGICGLESCAVNTCAANAGVK